jgi:hypothetical protein
MISIGTADASATSEQNANARRRRLYAGRGGQRLKQIAFRADDADHAVSDLGALCEARRWSRR